MDATRLDAIPLFAGLTLDQRASVAGSCDELVTEAGSTLVQEGDFGYGMFAITSGTADVIIDGAVVRTLGPGDMFGEIAVLSLDPFGKPVPDLPVGLADYATAVRVHGDDISPERHPGAAAEHAAGLGGHGLGVEGLPDPERSERVGRRERAARRRRQRPDRGSRRR